MGKIPLQYMRTCINRAIGLVRLGPGGGGDQGRRVGSTLGEAAAAALVTVAPTTSRVTILPRLFFRRPYQTSTPASGQRASQRPEPGGARDSHAHTVVLACIDDSKCGPSRTARARTHARDGTGAGRLSRPNVHDRPVQPQANTPIPRRPTPATARPRQRVSLTL